MSNHPFFGTKIARAQQEEHIRAILNEYRSEPAGEELKAKVYWRLMEEKHAGRVIIPFKVILNKSETPSQPTYVDVVLDSKV